eukprot:TRINITY_DN940_c0_g1_i1.p1 TRINITY_DN940_c0_g1~~TRINITY_DN940_c0_g1_i1.p1  ORF type:complete len:251 (+),score=56.03 TRINITY_DN940_c0_g1_i1:693-1445(+)
MGLLGYGSGYWTQGGDWGSIVTGFMAYLDKDHVLGYHSNFPLTSPPYGRGIGGIIHSAFVAMFPSWMLPEEELSAWGRQTDLEQLLRNTGYFHLQATKPQTIGYALNDSPVGLAAYIIEKFETWSDSGGDIETRFSKDDLLTNVMLYWATQSITSSMRFYFELFSGKNNCFELLRTMYISVPCGLANFPVELTGGIRTFANYMYNVVQWSRFSHGGHFAALEEPQELVRDLWAFRRLVVSKISSEPGRDL